MDTPRTPRLAGKVVLISGGARGMGAAEARLFAREGARVVVGDVLDAEGAAVAGAIGEAATFVRLDVTREDDWARAVALAVERYGALNVLVNNAGIGGSSRVEDTTIEAWDRVMDVNAKGVFLGTRAAALSSTSPPSWAWSAWTTAAPSTRPPRERYGC